MRRRIKWNDLPPQNRGPPHDNTILLDASSPFRLERLPDVLARTGLGRSTLYQLVSRGEFPRQLKLTERCVAWISHEVDQWIRDRITERDSN